MTIYDPERHEGRSPRDRRAELSALGRPGRRDRRAARGLPADLRPAHGAPRGFEGLVRPLPDSGFTDPGSMFAAAEATGRTVELDLACLNTVMEPRRPAAPARDR